MTQQTYSTTIIAIKLIPLLVNGIMTALCNHIVFFTSTNEIGDVIVDPVYVFAFACQY